MGPRLKQEEIKMEPKWNQMESKWNQDATK